MGRPGANLLVCVCVGGWAPRDIVLSPVIANPVTLVTGATNKFYLWSAQAGGLWGQLKGSALAQPPACKAPPAQGALSR